jgi:hypothetical protein
VTAMLAQWMEVIVVALAPMTVSGSVANPACLSRIPDPNFFHPGYRIRIK